VTCDRSVVLLNTTFCDKACQWLVTGRFFYSIQHFVIKLVRDLWQVGCFIQYNILWYSLFVTSDRSVLLLNSTFCDKACQWLVTGRLFYSIQHFVIKLVRDLWQVGCFTQYNILWYSLSVTCDRSVVLLNTTFCDKACPWLVTGRLFYSIQHFVIKFVSDLWQVGCFTQYNILW
jgi:hypothetical protein